jgi:hypothetical protein
LHIVTARIMLRAAEFLNREEEMHMKKDFKFYCWMKVCPAQPPKLTLDSKVPPKRSSAKKPAGVKHEVWTGINNLWNQTGTIQWAIHYGDAFSDDGDAKAWISDPNKGGAWLQEKGAEAHSYSLACFEIHMD